MYDLELYGNHKKAIRQAVELLRHVVAQAELAASEDAESHFGDMMEQTENTPPYADSEFLHGLAVKEEKSFKDLRDAVDNILKGLR